MGITLTGKTVSSTYDSLLKLTDNDSLNASFKLITDGLGNDTGISINNSGNVNISGTLTVGTRVNTPILQLTGGTGTQGTMSWNADEETVDLIQNGSTLQLGQEIQVHCKNQTGATIPDGTPVYVTGTLGASGRLTIAPMIADGSIPAKYFIGVTTEAIANGDDGKVTTFGKIRGLNTAAYSEGQTLWVSATTAGAFVTTRPVAPNLDLEVAIVINSHVNNGTLFIRSSIGHYLGTAHDVNISSVAENDLLVYKTNRWVNSKSIGDLSAANVTLSGYLRGPATFVIDPAAYGDETGLVQILGDLRVDGTTTTINSTTISVSDKNITLAKDAATAGDANGAGLTIAGANATLTYLSATDDFTFNKNVNASRFVGPLTGDVTGTVSDLSNHDTDDLAEGLTNLYFTTARARAAFSAGTGVSIASGVISIGQSVGTTDDVTFGTVTASLSGNATTASALANARNIALDGSVTGNADFDGSGNITITTTTNHNHDDRYYTETESDAKYLLNTTDTLDGNLTVTGDLIVTGGIDLSNADLDIGSADIIFGTTAGGATRGLIWDVSGSGFLSKLIGGGADGGKVTLFANMDDAITTGNIFEIKDGSTGSLFLGLSHAGILTAGGGTSTQWNTAYGWGNHAGLYLSSNNDSEQIVGLRDAYWNYGANRMYTDPRWNESGYDADLGCLHIYSTTSAGVSYGRAGLALYNGAAYQYITTKESQNAIYVNNYQIITAETIGSQSVNYAASAGSTGSLAKLGDYVWNASTNGRDFYQGIQTSFVSANEGYPNYGSAVRVHTYNNDGGSAELYFPYSATYGGSSMRYRLGQYDNAGWTGWKTVIDSDNIGTQSVAYATNAGLLDSIDSTSFLRSDVNDYASGKVFFTYNTALDPLAAVEINGGGTHTGLYINPAASSQAHIRFGTDSTLKWQIRVPFQDGVDADMHIYSWVGADDMFKFKHTGVMHFKKSSGTIISTGGGSDAFGYNTTYGHYIQGTASRYIYGDGYFYDGAVTRTLIHSGNIAAQSVASAGNADTLDSLDSSQFLRSDANANKSGWLSVYSGIGASDNVRSGLAHYDTTAQATGVGGQIVLGYKYTDDGSYTEGAIIKMYKENGTNGHYGSGLKFQVRNNGQDLNTKMTLDPSGNLGVGIASPGAKLEVKAGSTYTGHTGSAIKISNAGYRDGFVSSYTEGSYLTHYFENYTGGNGRYYDRILEIVCKGSPDGTYGEGVISFKANPITSGAGVSEIMRITGSKRVGINTMSPQKTLHVYSGAENEGIFMEGTGGGHWFNFKSGTSNLWSMGAQTGLMGWYNRTDNTYKMVITDGGSVGIGTTSPVIALSVRKDINDWIGQFKNYGDSAYGLTVDLSGSTGGQLGYALGVYTQGGTGMFVRNNGNVGIGTTNPQTKLNVYGGHGDAKIRLYSTGDGGGNDASLDMWASEPGISYDGSGIGNNVAGHPYYGRRNTALGQSYMRFGNGFIALSTGTGNANERMRITSDGNVGIGTTSPSEKLQVVGGASIINVKSTTAGANANVHFETTARKWGIGANMALGSSLFEIYDYTAGSNRFVLNDNGYVGIGTTSPSAKLTVNGVIRSTDQVDVSPSVGAFRFYDGGTFYGGFGVAGWSGVGASSDITLYLPSTSSNKFHISRNTTAFATFDSANSSFKVESTIGTGDNVRYGIAHYDDTPVAAGVGGQIVLGYKYTSAGDRTEGAIIKMYKENGTSGQYGSGLKFQVRNHGVGLSTKLTLDPSGNLTAVGDVYAYSDARVKENVKTIDNALDKVMSMRGVSYNKIDDVDKEIRVGVIAQEIQQVLPEVVSEQEDGMLSVSYGNIVGVLIEAIKEQQKQIDELKAIINGSTK